jgi:hypothetical protein
MMKSIPNSIDFTEVERPNGPSNTFLHSKVTGTLSKPPREGKIFRKVWLVITAGFVAGYVMECAFQWD